VPSATIVDTERRVFQRYCIESTDFNNSKMWLPPIPLLLFFDNVLRLPSGRAAALAEVSRRVFVFLFDFVLLVVVVVIDKIVFDWL
jgi:hypothetical protein